MFLLLFALIMKGPNTRSYGKKEREFDLVFVIVRLVFKSYRKY